MTHVPSTSRAASLSLENTYADRLDGAYAEMDLAGAPDAKLVAFNEPLAAALGLDAPALEKEIADIVAGNVLAMGSRPIAMAYAGHQFGHLSPLLGDGRAVLLGEVVKPQGGRFDIHLKGSGRTPFSRGGDGRATLGPILREYLVSEAMFHLGIPTSRVLACVTTGDSVARETSLPGAVLARVAASHLRVGTFVLFAHRGEDEMVRRLVEFSLDRHYPGARSPNPALALLDAVIGAQAELIADWMRVGFVHGVMNTDNFTISGETIDYGPCAFMEAYDPQTVFSSIDRGGRYAYGNQPGIAMWNLARFAETLLPLIDEHEGRAVEKATACLETFRARYEEAFERAMRAKLGLAEARPEDIALITNLLTHAHSERLDFTNFFRELAESLRAESLRSEPSDDAPPVAAWRARVLAQDRSPAAIADAMDAVNPLYIARNAKVEEALAAAHDGDLGPFDTLLSLVRAPYAKQDVDASYTSPRESNVPYKTFCGT